MILAIDQSLTKTGVCIDGKTSLLVPKSTGVARLVWIRDQLQGFLPVGNPLHIGVQNPYRKAPMVVIEGYSMGSRNSQAHSLGELGGMIRLWCHDLNLRLAVIPPSCLKKWATGKGNADKAAVISEISRRTGQQWASSDEVDAWCLWAMARQQLGDPVIKMPADRAEALKKCEWP